MTIKWEKRISFFFCIGMIAVNLLVYGDVLKFDSVNIDDSAYLTKNWSVQQGITKDNLRFWFTFPSLSGTHNWDYNPLTMISFAIGCHLHGLDFGWHHATNLLFHILNTLLLFIMFKQSTKRLWPSAFIATVFALHPLHVESVAWIAERKDVLNTFFGFASIWAYILYIHGHDRKYYLMSILCYLMSLLSKSMLVTLPFLLILIDIWPLNRIKLQNFSLKNFNSLTIDFKRILLEKLPYFFLSAIFIAINMIVSTGKYATISFNTLPIETRLANAIISYAAYIQQTIWPFDMVVFYPYPAVFSSLSVLGNGILLLVISIVVIGSGKRHPYVLVGWLWFLGTLVPVIGIIQIWIQARADRFMYVPQTGIFIMVVWYFLSIAEHKPWVKKLLPFLSIFLISLYGILAWVQTGYWKNSFSLFEHAIHASKENFIAHKCIAKMYKDKGQNDISLHHYDEALQAISKTRMGEAQMSDIHNDIGLIMLSREDWAKAAFHFEKALALDPFDSSSLSNIGFLAEKQGDLTKAILFYRQALSLNINDAYAHFNLGRILTDRSEILEAIQHYQEAIRIQPNYKEAYLNLGNLFMHEQKYALAFQHFSTLYRLFPDYKDNLNNIGSLYLRIGRQDQAEQFFKEATRVDPEYELALLNLGELYYIQSKFNLATMYFLKAKRVNPERKETEKRLLDIAKQLDASVPN
ncbi:MAG: tetratricopeptide repeat protein [Desulfobacterales bacterium]|nr:tetratricopeptide repeat protein [Desulfobacterales bacterium]